MIKQTLAVVIHAQTKLADPVNVPNRLRWLFQIEGRLEKGRVAEKPNQLLRRFVGMSAYASFFACTFMMCSDVRTQGESTIQSQSQ